VQQNYYELKKNNEFLDFFAHECIIHSNLKLTKIHTNVLASSAYCKYFVTWKKKNSPDYLW
jgi:hypothetical protein